MRKFIPATLLLVALVSCAHKNPITEQPIPVSLSLSVSTKVTDSAFETGDRIGLYMAYSNTLASSGNYGDNLLFTHNRGEWTPQFKLYWRDNSSPASFFCYYPYAPSIADAHAYSLELETDQTTETAYKASDFIWGKTLHASAGQVVALSMSHMMSVLTVVLQPGTGFTEAEFAKATKSVEIEGLKTAARVDLEKGTVVPDGTAVKLLPWATEGAFKAIVVPQTVSSSAFRLKVKVNDSVYESGADFTFEPGTQHKLTVTVDKSSFGLDITLNKWKIDEEDHFITVK